MGVQTGCMPCLTSILHPSLQSVARMEAVMNLYQEMMKYAGEMPSTSPSLPSFLGSWDLGLCPNGESL